MGYINHVPKRCFALHPNDDIAFTKCTREDTEHFAESMKEVSTIVLFGKIKLTHCHQTSADPKPCFVDVHRMLKEQFHGIFQGATSRFNPQGYSAPGGYGNK